MHFAAFSNILLETLVTNLVPLTRPSLPILGKTQAEVFPISGKSLIKENCDNSRTNGDIDMKLGPVTKIDKKNKATSKYSMVTPCQQIVMSFSFFQFRDNLEHSRSRFRGA